MKDIKEIKERFLKDSAALRLGNLAANLSRIVSFSDNPKNCKIIESIIDESEHFIEWSASDFELQIQSDLVALQIKLALWHRQWQKIIIDNKRLAEMRSEAKKASQRLLELAGIL